MRQLALENTKLTRVTAVMIDWLTTSRDSKKTEYDCQKNFRETIREAKKSQ
jgi:hypothetical protein